MPLKIPFFKHWVNLFYYSKNFIGELGSSDSGFGDSGGGHRLSGDCFAGRVVEAGRGLIHELVSGAELGREDGLGVAGSTDSGARGVGPLHEEVGVVLGSSGKLDRLERKPNCWAFESLLIQHLYFQRFGPSQFKLEIHFNLLMPKDVLIQ